MKIVQKICVLGLTMMLVSTPLSPVLAQGTQLAFSGLQHDSNQPVEVTSDSLSVDQETGKAVFSGNVIVGQGDLRLSAAMVEVLYESEGSAIEQLRASGGVTLTNAGESIEASEAVYNLKTAQVILSGNVIVTQSGSALSGDRMTVDLTSGAGQIDGRVKTILQPRPAE